MHKEDEAEDVESEATEKDENHHKNRWRRNSLLHNRYNYHHSKSAEKISQTDLTNEAKTVSQEELSGSLLC
jgi:hypothetical protein